MPGGPAIDSHTGPPLDSIVIVKVRNRQHWRSAAPPVNRRVALALSLATCLVVGCVRRETRRIHEQNMAKAEVFKRELDEQVPIGSSRETVDTYLATHHLKISNLLDASGTGSGFVEMFREESPNWFCGKGDVGLALEFRSNRLIRSSAGSWSFDCP